MPADLRCGAIGVVRQVLSARWIRSAVSAAGVAAAIAALPATAAAEPVHYQLSFSNTVTLANVCPFDVTITYTQTGQETDFYGAATTLTRFIFAGSETSVFSANGKTLTSDPIRFSVQATFDAAGNVTSASLAGVVARIRLPDGSVFVSAGQLDFLGHPGEPFVLTADVGHSGNVAAFCAALAA